MTKRTILLACVATLALLLPPAAAQQPQTAPATASAPAQEVGTLTYVAVNANAGIDGGALLDCPDERFVAPAPGSGTVSPDAVVAVARYLEQPPVYVAVDAMEAGGTALNCVRLDFTGRGSFADAAVLPLTVTADTPAQPATATQPARPAVFQASFGPAEVMIPRGGRSIPAQVYGEYANRGGTKWLGLKIGMAVEGPCRFGENVRLVRVLDGNGNLRPGDPMPARLVDGQLVIPPDEAGGVVYVTNGTLTGDTLLVDITGRAFRGRYAEQLYGQPVWVDQQWWDVTVSPEDMTVAARPLDLPTGRLKTGHDSWSSRLIGPNGCLVAVGIGEPDGAPLPAGEYAIMGFHEYCRTEGTRGSLVCRNRDVLDGHPWMVTIPADGTAEVRIGSPLTASVAVTKAEDSPALTLSLRLTDVEGAPIDTLRTGGADGLAEPPRVVVRDADGNVVFDEALARNSSVDYSVLWTPPAGAAGAFTAELTNVVAPCQTTLEKTPFTLE